MKIIFNQTISENECLTVAKDFILRAIKLNYQGVKGLKNPSQVKNRITEKALEIFINRNYYKESKIVCAEMAMHHNKPIGAVLKYSVGEGELTRLEYVKHLKNFRKLTNVLIDKGLITL